ncbi:DUF401 family protein [Desulfitibacter alkalitolerans]|uniref:DUF401 family protein n=1 Tax=Desulfitibacter alkalitolerans TaxID=264641 RepID=UPI0004856D33|nr:DUF401 family protein [Desulfitibacter alkalitolerans]
MELLGLFIALVAIVLVTSKWHEVIYALLLGVVFIIIFSAMPINLILSIFMKVTFNLDTISLMIVVLLITLFSSVMYKTLLLNKLLKSLIDLVKSIHLLIALIPALVGLLAVPGGAVMSAPFIDQLGEKVKMSAGYKSAANTFYRHLSVFFNPLAPLLIIAADLSTLGFLPLMKFHLIPVIITLVISLIVINRFWPHESHESSVSTNQGEAHINNSFAASLKSVLFTGLPLIVAIVLTIILEVNFIIALVIAIALTILLDYKEDKILKTSDIKIMLSQGINWRLGFSVYAIMLFGAFVKDSGAIPILAQIITNSNMPLLLILILSSVIIGFAAGHPIVGSAILYPIFLPLIGENVAYLSLILTGMMFGYVVSPIHLCLIVSNEYFKADYLESYKLLFPLQAVLMIAGIIVAVLI